MINNDEDDEDDEDDDDDEDGDERSRITPHDVKKVRIES